MSKKWRELLSLFVVSGAKSVTKDCLVVESSLPLNRKLLDQKDSPQIPLHVAPPKFGREQPEQRYEYEKDESFRCLVVRINGCNCRRSQNFLG